MDSLQSKLHPSQPFAGFGWEIHWGSGKDIGVKVNPETKENP